MNRINTSNWEEIKHLHTICLCYSETKGLYTTPIALATKGDILFLPHGYKGFWYQENTIPKENLKIRVETNFGYGNHTFLKATVEKDGKRLLDFDKSKIYILNNCSIMTQDVMPYAWENLFNKIISASRNSNPELCKTSVISYIEEISKLLDKEEILIKSSFLKDYPTKWTGEFLITLHTAKKIRDLIKGCNTANISNRFFLDKIVELCHKYLQKVQEINIDLSDQRTHQLSESLFIIHEFMIKNGHGDDFFKYFIKKSNIKA